jgi:hypothetical protein
VFTRQASGQGGGAVVDRQWVVRSPTQPSVLSEACLRAAPRYRWAQRRILAEDKRPERTSGSNLAISRGVCTRMCGARAYEASSSARATGGAEATPRARAGFSGSCEVGRYGLDGAALLAGAGRSAARAAAVLVAPALGARQSGLAVWMTRYGQVQRARHRASTACRRPVVRLAVVWRRLSGMPAARSRPVWQGLRRQAHEGTILAPGEK